MDNYEKDCQLGRRRAAQVVGDCAAIGDMPRLVREMREAAADRSGVGVGFMFECAERLGGTAR